MSVKTEYKVREFEFLLVGATPVTVDRLKDALPSTVVIKKLERAAGINGRDAWALIGLYGPVLGNWPSDPKRIVVDALRNVGSAATVEEKNHRIVARWPRELGPQGGARA